MLADRKATINLYVGKACFDVSWRFAECQFAEWGSQKQKEIGATIGRIGIRRNAR